MRVLFAILIISHFSILLKGQVNIKIGYGLGFVNADVNNQILEEFNELKRMELSDSLSLPFKNLGSMHGLQLGLRFKFSGNSAIELSWEGMSNSRKAIGEINNQSLFRQELFYNFNNYYFAYQSQFNLFGMGVGVGLNKVRIKDRLANSDFKEVVVNENQLFARINLGFYFESSRSITFSIQPYFQISLDDIDLIPLRNELGLPQQNQVLEPFTMFGINLIFYNGRQ